jgi:DNA-directed RNA polymerase subunit RPC12/RpoP
MARFSEGVRFTRLASSFRGEVMIDEKIKIKCSKCSMTFRERGQRIREGYQLQCTHCFKLLTFDSSSGDNNIRRALKSAKEVRTLMEEARQNSRDEAAVPKGAPKLEG